MTRPTLSEYRRAMDRKHRRAMDEAVAEHNRMGAYIVAACAAVCAIAKKMAQNVDDIPDDRQRDPVVGSMMGLSEFIELLDGIASEGIEDIDE